MLQSFTGTIDRGGIRSLRPETDKVVRLSRGAQLCQFWAVLSDEEIPIIRAVIDAGDRLRAMKLICERAVSIGSILPDQ